MKTFTLLLLCLVGSLRTFAQNAECATDFVHSYLMEHDTAYRNQMLSLETQVTAILEHSPPAVLPVYTIPVVVHVIHLGEPVGTGTNISDAQVQGAVAGLTNHWRNIVGSGVDVEIEFCLASRDPNGNATSGINRVDGSAVTNYAAQGINLSGCGTGAVEDSVKRLSRWPVSSYYNIWIVKAICNGYWGGWTYYPYGGVNDGATIVYAYFTGSSTLPTHEVGHGFYAYHTFEGDGGNSVCPLDTNCSLNGDRVCDTPPHKQGDCGLTDPCVGAGAWDDTRYNYMSYCSSLNRFTQGQKDRMRTVATVPPRASLLTSLGCSAPLAVEDVRGFENAISIIPNPSNGNFKLQVNKKINHGRIEILNVLSEKVYEGEIRDLQSTIHLNVHAGIYFLKINDGEKQAVEQLIIN